MVVHDELAEPRVAPPQPGLLLRLPEGGLLRGLVRPARAAGQGPGATVMGPSGP